MADIKSQYSDEYKERYNYLKQQLLTMQKTPSASRKDYFSFKSRGKDVSPRVNPHSMNQYERFQQKEELKTSNLRSKQLVPLDSSMYSQKHQQEVIYDNGDEGLSARDDNLLAYMKKSIQNHSNLSSVRQMPSHYMARQKQSGQQNQEGFDSKGHQLHPPDDRNVFKKKPKEVSDDFAEIVEYLKRTLEEKDEVIHQLEEQNKQMRLKTKLFEQILETKDKEIQKFKESKILESSTAYESPPKAQNNTNREMGVLLAQKDDEIKKLNEEVKNLGIDKKAMSSIINEYIKVNKPTKAKKGNFN